MGDLAELIDEKPVAVIKFLMTDLGVMASMTQSLDPATCIAVVEGFGKIVGGADDMDEELYVIGWAQASRSCGLLALCLTAFVLVIHSLVWSSCRRKVPWLLV